MFIWNRVEVLVTLSLDYYMQVRYLLQQHHVRNQTHRVQVEKSGWQHRSDGMLRRRAMEYHLYVDQKDAEQAVSLIQGIGPDSILADEGI